MEYQKVIVDDIDDLSNVMHKYQVGAFCLKNKLRTMYLLDGALHRDDGPAYIENNYGIIKNTFDEKTVVYLRGNPAQCSPTHYYYRFGEQHCEFGPAHIEYNNKYMIVNAWYYLFGVEMSKEEWDQHMETKLYW